MPQADAISGAAKLAAEGAGVSESGRVAKTPIPAGLKNDSTPAKSTPAPKPVETKAPTTLDELKAKQKMIPSMAKGGPVKKTGLYKLHSGESVIPKKSMDVLTGKDQKKTKVVNVGKKDSFTKRATKKAFDEVHSNTPAIVKKTTKKEGKEAGEKQRVAIALSKARAAGANIPEKK